MRHLIGCWLLALLGTGASARISQAAQPDGATREVAGLIGELRASDFVKRERATLELMQLEPQYRSDVEQALAHESEPEVIVRLQRIALHLFMKARTGLQGDVGVLGISLMGELVQLDAKSPAATVAIMVVKAQPGFPAAEVLEPADRIIAFNGERFFQVGTTEEFRRKVNGSAPGSIVRLTIVRDGKVMDVGVRVAGLAMNEVPLFEAIVAKREQMSREYVTGLANAGEKRPLLIAGGSSQEQTMENDGTAAPQF